MFFHQLSFKKVQKTKILKRITGNLCLFIISLVLIHNSAYAQGEKYSFRLRGFGQGLFGIVDDLYSDLSFNPSYINRYKGSTLFTNISNLQGKADQNQFNQNGDFSLTSSIDVFPNNLIGTITDQFGSPVGAFWESQGYNLSFSEKSDIEEFTSLTTGIFKGRSTDIGADFSGHSISVLGNIKGYGVSLSLHRLGFEIDFNEKDISQIFSQNDSTLLRENTESLITSSNRSFSFPNSMFAFSIGKVFKSENSEFSFSFGRRPERISFDASEIFALFKEPFFGGGEGKFDDFKKNDLGFMEVALKSYFVNMRYKDIKPALNSLQQNSYMFKYERFILPVSISAEESTVHDSLAVAGASRKRITLTQNGFTEGNGNGRLNNVEFGIGREKHFNNFRSMIAFGAKVNYLWGDLDFTMNPGRMIETLDINVEIGDPAEESDSYKRTISDNIEQKTSGSIKSLILSIPVGIETKITDKFTLRLGARSIIPFTFKTDWKTETIDGIDELINTSEDATTYTPVDNFLTKELKTTKIDGKSLNLDSYHFGARYAVNDAITIDLLHFAKVTELDTWWLSLTLKY